MKALAHTMKIAPEATRLGLIVYNIEPRIVVGFNETAKQNATAIEHALDNETELKGKTFTDKALKQAGDDMFTPKGGDRPDKPDILIVITDGKTNPKSEKYEDLYNKPGFLVSTSWSVIYFDLPSFIRPFFVLMNNALFLNFDFLFRKTMTESNQNL